MRTSIAACLCLSSFLCAQEATPAKPTGSFGIDFTNQYFFRGIFQENQGFIAQPHVELGWGLYEGTENLKSLSLALGSWNSLHEGPSGSAGGTSMWYESDFYTTLAGTFGERWRGGATYTSYYSPNGRFGTVQEIAFSAGFDDKGLVGDSIASGLQPSAVLAFELDGQADAGTQRGIYGQVGINPSFGVGQLGSLDVTLSVPVTLGFSLGHYYEDPTNGGSDDAFGFLDIGVVASSALPFLPARAGAWTGSLGLHWLQLGNNNEERNVNESSELIVSFGVSTSF